MAKGLQKKKQNRLRRFLAIYVGRVRDFQKKVIRNNARKPSAERTSIIVEGGTSPMSALPVESAIAKPKIGPATKRPDKLCTREFRANSLFGGDRDSEGRGLLKRSV